MMAASDQLLHLRAFAHDASFRSGMLREAVLTRKAAAVAMPVLQYQLAHTVLT